MNAQKLAKRYRVKNGKSFRLKDYAPDDKIPSKSDSHLKQLLEKELGRLRKFQDKLYADDRHSLLIIFQAMDAAGKDGTIKHVMSGVNPQGCEVHSFKTPSPEETSHTFLWRACRHLPSRGRIGIFNRSHYEDVLVVRVHPEFLDNLRLPDSSRGEKFWKARFEDIRNFERHLVRNGVTILKFFLNVSEKEQRLRFLARCEDEKKNWKFSASDMKERAFWKDYMRVYEDMIRNTATDEAPWFVVPADDKLYTHLVVSSVITEALDGMKLAYPKVDAEKLKLIASARRQLGREG